MAGTENATTWFRSDRTTRFLERVRSLAPERLGHLVEPGATWETDYAGCLLIVDVPEVGDDRFRIVYNHLQIRWDHGVLGGYWGDSYLWDEFDERDDEALHVRGLPLSDEQAADAALDWLARQLSRPLDHQIWMQNEEVVAERWIVADTGLEIGRRGSKQRAACLPQS